MSARAGLVRTASVALAILLASGTTLAFGPSTLAAATDGSDVTAIGDPEGEGQGVADIADTPEIAPGTEVSPPPSTETELETASVDAPIVAPTEVSVADVPSSEDTPEEPADSPVTTAPESDALTATDCVATGHTLTWGVKEAWGNYVFGPIARGSITAECPAEQSERDLIWSDGVVDASGHAITYAGTMFSAGHYGHGANGGPGLDQRLSDLRVELTSATTAELSANVTQSAYTVFQAHSGQRVVIADLAFTEDDLADGQVTAAGVFADTSRAVFGNYGNFEVGSDVAPVIFNFEPGSLVVPTSIATTTLLSVSKTDLIEGATAALSATVQPEQVAGDIVFSVGGSTVGKPVTVKNGRATMNWKASSEGSYQFRATFVPSDPASFVGSSSAAVDVTVKAKEVQATEGMLRWGVKQSFRNYVTGPIAHGTIKATRGAAQTSNNGVFTYPQAKGGSWNGATGTVQYAGNVNFFGHDGEMNVNLANPMIQVTSSKTALVKVPFGSKNDLITLAKIDLSSAKKTNLSGDAVRFSSATVTLASAGAKQFFVNNTGEGPAGQFYTAGTQLDDITFVIGASSDTEVVAPPPTKPNTSGGGKEDEGPAPSSTDSNSAAGSLNWGVSSAFAAYTTCENKESYGFSHCANGSISTSGVGAGYLFPQSTDGTWNKTSQTGTVNYSGVVSFTGYGMTMFRVANPSITVTDGNTATLNTGNDTSFGSVSYSLDLSSADKAVGPNGEVTWSNVPVRGSLSSGGAGGSGSQSIGLDNLSFTVGSASAVSYGSTEQGSDKEKRTAADSAPATTGITVLTDAAKIKPGGRIELEARGFDPKDEGVLVVLYGAPGTDPVVLDEEATASATGVVSWSGTLPKETTGEHTITLQGSTDAGAVIDILDTEAAKKAAAKSPVVLTEQQEAQAAGVAAVAATPANMSTWEWWASAGGLVAIAACMTLLVIRQRKLAE